MHANKANQTFVYAIDAHDILISVNSNWLSFARDNQANHLVADAVTGKPLLKFISDVETRHLYRNILDSVRETQRDIVVPFRCDGPAVKRFMELQISPEAEGSVMFEGRILREEKRESTALFDTAVERSEEFITVCSWCKNVDISGDWVDVEVAINQLQLFHLQRLPQLTHGVCEDCAKQMHDEFYAWLQITT